MNDDSLKAVIDDMRQSVSFNRTPYHLLPQEFRVQGCLLGEAVVVRSAVADRVEGWADRLDKIRSRMKDALSVAGGEDGKQD